MSSSCPFYFIVIEYANAVYILLLREGELRKAKPPTPKKKSIEEIVTENVRRELKP